MFKLGHVPNAIINPDISKYVSVVEGVVVVVVLGVVIDVDVAVVVAGVKVLVVSSCFWLLALAGFSLNQGKNTII